MSQESSVLYSVENQIATITLNRPKSLNSMNDSLIAELSQCLTKAQADGDARSVVLTGNGRAFCAGGDLSYLGQLTDVVSAKNFISAVGQIVVQMQNLTKPIVAMVNGVAAGAGFNLALAADIVYCAQSARFAQSFAKVGLVPDCAGMYLLPRVIGAHKAKELMFTADLINAADAYGLGLVNKVVADDKLRDETYAFAAKLNASAPIALELIKRTINSADQLSLCDLLAQEASLQTLCMQTADHREGLKAFMEKRAPQFTGK